MKCKKVKAVLRYHTPNKIKEPESYFHHLLMLYYPWRDENNLMSSDQTYASKFYEPDVQAIVEHSRELFEPDADAVREAFEDLEGDMHDPNPDESFNEQIPSHFGPTQSNQNTNLGVITSYNRPTDISDDMLHQTVRSLNIQQRCAYDTFLS